MTRKQSVGQMKQDVVDWGALWVWHCKGKRHILFFSLNLIYMVESGKDYSHIGTKHRDREQTFDLSMPTGEQLQI